MTEDITTPTSDDAYPVAGEGAPYKAFSSDLLRGLMLNGLRPVENLPPPLPADAPPRYENYFLRDNVGGGFEALVTSAPSEEPSKFFLELLGVTPDLRHIVMGTPAALTPEATANGEGNNLYEWAGDRSQRLQPINVPLAPVKPNETTSERALLGTGRDESRTVASDGSRVFWSLPHRHSLFMRENVGQPQSPVDGAGNCMMPSDACTIQVDRTEVKEPKTSVEESGYGKFITASASGSKVFFTDQQRLTPGSTAGGEAAHQDLYLFNVETGRLTDLTPDERDVGGASVLGVLEASEDGSYVYFVAEGVLSGVNGDSRLPTVGSENLYMWHESAFGEATTTFIAALANSDNGHSSHQPVVANDWEPSTAFRTARATPNGRRLVFMSDESLTGYDNRDAKVAGMRDEEVYIYDAVSGHLTCVSCNPGGVRPDGPSGIPGGTPWLLGGALGTYQSHVLDEAGDRVFFDSRDALVPQDTNGEQDVYEWEQDGTGSCRVQGGCVFLLSSGTNNGESSFVDASASGNDAFFITRTQLVGQDTDQLRDLYDARVGGGFPQPASPAPCEEESCLPPIPPQPTPASMASATFNGVGNLLPAVTSKSAATKVKAKKRSKPKKRRRPAKKAGHKAGIHVAHRSHRRG